MRDRTRFGTSTSPMRRWAVMFAALAGGDLAVPTDKAMRTSLLDDYGQASGILLPESVAAEVERLWANHIRDVYGEMP
jgi:hypothetical protein